MTINWAIVKRLVKQIANRKGDSSEQQQRQERGKCDFEESAETTGSLFPLHLLYRNQPYVRIERKDYGRRKEPCSAKRSGLEA